MPRCTTEAMAHCFEEIAATVAPGAHAALLLDQAGWHTTRKLTVPDNITLLPLPARSPELNPVENFWQFMWDNWLGDRVFRSHTGILRHRCNTWNMIIAQLWTHHVHRTAPMGSRVLIN